MRHILLMAFALISAVSLGLSLTNMVEANEPAQTEFYVSPEGSGGECSLSSPCSLERARDGVRSANSDMSGDIVVYLRGGTYELSSTFELSGRDSGTNGHNVIYQAYPGEEPVLSGGKKVTGWSLYDSSKGIYRAKVDPSLNTRQLYVNGVRATRARSEDDPAGFVPTATGYETTDPQIAGWDNEADLDNPIEFVDLEQWRHYYCGVEEVSGTSVTMMQPCWDNARLDAEGANYMPRMNEPAWIENAYELLDSPGEWYLDRSEGYMYYKPKSGEDLATAEVVAPKLETLLSLEGTLDEPVHDVEFKGLTFTYSTWLRPNTSEGYAPNSAGFLLAGEYNPRRLQKVHAGVSLRAAKSVVFERNLFTRMGSNALNIDFGSQENAIVGNKFEDISASGVYLGDVQDEDHHPEDPRMVLKDNRIEDNYVARVGEEFFDGIGIGLTFADGTIIEHNEVDSVPYIGMLIGWGTGMPDAGGAWGYKTPTISRDNMVKYNLVHDYNKVLRDGGGIQTSASMPGSEVSHNYINTQTNDQAALYPDMVTKGVSFTDNVSSRVLSWMFLWYRGSTDNEITGNYSSSPKFTSVAANDFGDNTLVAPDQNWPSEAREIMFDAGLEPGYRDIKRAAAPAADPPEDTAPGVTITRPASITRDRTPQIEAIVRDEDGQLKRTDIALSLDGQRVRERDFSYDRRTGMLSFTPGRKLTLDRHLVAVSARGTDAAWSFWVTRDPTSSNVTADNLRAEATDYAPGASEVTVEADVSAGSPAVVEELAVGGYIKGTSPRRYFSFYPEFEQPIERTPKTVSFKRVVTEPGTYVYHVAYYTVDQQGHRSDSQIISPEREFTVE